jgi:hypothetical protein
MEIRDMFLYRRENGQQKPVIRNLPYQRWRVSLPVEHPLWVLLVAARIKGFTGNLSGGGSGSSCMSSSGRDRLLE